MPFFRDPTDFRTHRQEGHSPRGRAEARPSRGNSQLQLKSDHSALQLQLPTTTNKATIPHLVGWADGRMGNHIATDFALRGDCGDLIEVALPLVAWGSVPLAAIPLVAWGSVPLAALPVVAWGPVPTVGGGLAGKAGFTCVMDALAASAIRTAEQPTNRTRMARGAADSPEGKRLFRSTTPNYN